MTNNFVLRKINGLKILIAHSFAKNNMKTFHVMAELKSSTSFLSRNQSINFLIDNP